MSYVTLMDDTMSLTDIANDNTNGLGVINAITCRVTEELNGIYECEFEFPMTDIRFSDVHVGGIFKAKPSETMAEQMFRIYHISKPMRGIITVSAHHISYDLNKCAVTPFSATGAASAMAMVKAHRLGSYPFEVYTDLTNTTSTFKVETPKSFRACLGGSQGSILDVFGGQYEWDNLTVKLYQQRGHDNGVTIEYGKNLIDLTQEENIENTYTAVLGYATASETTVTGDLQYAVQTSSPKTLIIDFSGEFDTDETPTKARLNALAQSYIQRNAIGVPNVNISVKFVPLWQTEEYKNVAPLERVTLGDTVTVKFTRLGVSSKATIVRTVYNVLEDRYESVEIGSLKSSLSRTLASAIDTAEGAVDEVRSFIDTAVSHASSIITGGLGGYVVMSRNANGKPEEILIMDSADKATAVNVIRMNKNGIGFSRNGYNGPFVSAWTIDGSFVADFITTGTLNGSMVNVTNINAGNINTGTLNANRIGANSIAVSKLTGTISNNNWVIDLTNGALTIGNISASNINTGTLNADNINVTNINGANIKTGTIGSAPIAGSAIINSKIDNGAVSYGKTSFTGTLDQVGTNASNIGTNSYNIGVNSGNIGTNAYNIGVNSGNISTNAGGVSRNSGNINTIVNYINTNEPSWHGGGGGGNLSIN